LENYFNVGHNFDPISFSQALASPKQSKWLEVMEDEMQSTEHNGVWELVEIPLHVKSIDCKWVFKARLACEIDS
jgi:hypothetical protein